jgi:cyclopropane fatty-acyl-phospholipid synthase-like methyltransferase
MANQKLEKTVLWKADMEVVAMTYHEHLKEVGIESPDATMNRSESEHDAHFSALFENVDLRGDASILDIGCGKGALISFIMNHYPHTKISHYRGIDLVPDFVDRSRKAFPNYHFDLENFLDREFTSNIQYDYVVALGVLVMQTHNYDEFIETFIRKMCDFSSKYVLFNFISGIDESSDQYRRQGEVGFPSVFSYKKLEKILRSISGIRYEIKSKAIFSDSTDSFVRIWR